MFWLKDVTKCDECGKIINIDEDEEVVIFRGDKTNVYVHIKCLNDIYDRIKNEF